MPEPLTVRNAYALYGKGSAAAVALDDVSLAFEPGEVTLLMGASGSGKSTLLAALGGLRKVDRGHVTLLGQDLESCPESELVRLRGRHIGFVFQFFRLLRALTALQNVEMGWSLAPRDVRKRSMKPKEALNEVGLSAKLHLLPDQMSGGERQRVAIARALVKSPVILLADEPTAALDSVNGLQIAELMYSLTKKSNIVTIIATHDVRLEPFADRVIELRDGRVVSDERRVA